MTIDCTTIQDLVAVCADLCQRGIGFRANANTLIITLTGAF